MTPSITHHLPYRNHLGVCGSGGDGEGWMPQLKEENVKFCKKKMGGSRGSQKNRGKNLHFCEKMGGSQKY